MKEKDDRLSQSSQSNEIKTTEQLNIITTEEYQNTYSTEEMNNGFIIDAPKKKHSKKETKGATLKKTRKKVKEVTDDKFPHIDLVEETGPVLSPEELGINEDMVESITVLANDRNTASSFFAPVVASAKKVLTGCHSVKEAANELSFLLANIFNYLDNRGASKISKQRNNRRAACYEVIADVGNFLRRCDETYSETIQIKVHELKKQHRTKPGELERFTMDYGYLISDESIKTQLAKKDILALAKQGAPQGISDIIFAMDGLNSLMTNKMPAEPDEDAEPEEIKAYEDEIKYVGFGISKMYRQIIDACNRFIRSGYVDPRHLEMVKDYMAGCEHDNKIFANGISEYIAGHKGEGVVTWEEAIAKKGSGLVQLNDDGVKKTGAGTSIVYKYEKDGETKFFKAEEKTNRNLRETWEEVYNNLENVTGYESVNKTILGELNEAMLRQIAQAEEVDFSEGHANADLKTQYDNLIKNFFCKGARNNIFRAKQSGFFDAGIDNPLIGFLAELPYNTATGGFINKVIDEFFKKFNSNFVAGYSAKIEPNRTVSNRNAATSRMADLLGISHMVLKSETTEVRNGRKKVIGNVMDQAKGQSAFDVFKDKNIKYSTEAIGQVATMHVFDIICGQVDRNNNNYFVSTQGNSISTIQMIDNDMSFGNLTAVGTKDVSVMSLVRIDYDMIDALPPEIKRAIRRLNNYSEGDLGFIFGDILKSDEIESLKTRIGMVVSAMDQRDQLYEDKIEEGDKEAQIIKDNMNDPKFRAIHYQYSLYNALDRFKTNKLNKFPLKEREGLPAKFIRANSYLNLDSMLPYEEVKREYEEYLKKGGLDKAKEDN